ncbi:MAG: hypothetical protein LDLANPLL_02106 [Turneriella sp.]|nr:hypothetical protein [Turneriella sp.]
MRELAPVRQLAEAIFLQIFVHYFTQIPPRIVPIRFSRGEDAQICAKFRNFERTAYKNLQKNCPFITIARVGAQALGTLAPTRAPVLK